MLNYNPYNLVDLLVNGKAIHGRPFEFDSQVADQKSMKNAFGFYVKPIKVSSMCPDCGQGFVISVSLSEPPFSPVVYTCINCRPAPPALADPFVNPILSGRIHLSELDPLLHNPNKILKTDEGRVVDKFVIPVDEPIVEVEPVASGSDFDLIADLNDTSTILEKADGIAEEEDDFDDSGMLDE